MNSVKQEIISLLEGAIGLNIDTVSNTTFRQALQRRMDALHIDDIRAYFRKLTVSADELRRLTEEVVIPETWFFRHQKAFNIFIKQMLQAKRNRRHFMARILSLPCSTGEEPYSVIMALLQAGIDPDHFYIKAVDISERALDIARRGVYGKNSFRSKELFFRNKFFNQVDKEFVLNESIRSKVHFSQGNIMDSSFTETLGHFDIIFCRNLLIYFGPETQQKVIDIFYNMLVPGGSLFTGHSEANLFLDDRFVRSPHVDSFAFHRKEKKIAFAADHASPKISAKMDRIPRTIRPATKRIKSAAIRHDQTMPTDRAKYTFESVMHLADAGKLTEAADCCEKHLQDAGPSARWYYLLGVIRDSKGESEEAVRLLRKALYLDPEHGESLFLLSLLAEQAGEHTKAMNYRRRVRKLQKKGK